MTFRPEQIFPLDIFDLISSYSDNKTFISLISTCQQLYKRNVKHLPYRKWSICISELRKIQTTTPGFYEHLRTLATALKKTGGKFIDDHRINEISFNEVVVDYNAEEHKDYIHQVDHIVICQEYYNNKLSNSKRATDYAGFNRPYAWLFPAFFHNHPIYSSDVQCKNYLYLDSRSNLRLTTRATGMNIGSYDMHRLNKRQSVRQFEWFSAGTDYDENFMLPLDIFIEIMGV